MAENSKIEWTDHTFNPWRGCAHKVLADGTPHPGCEHCYAEAMSKINPGTLGEWGDNGIRKVGNAKYWDQPLAWDAVAYVHGNRRRVFCASLADVFEDWHGPMLAAGKQPVFLGKDFRASRGENDRLTMDDCRQRLFKLIDATPHLLWLLLTKRPENVQRMWPERDDVAYVAEAGRMNDWGMNYRPNVAIGTSISDQPTADELVPKLLACRNLASVLFLSVEPLVGPIDFHAMTTDPPNSGFAITDGLGCVDGEGPGGIDWVIVGGESGHQARPLHPQWARDVRDQCTAAGVPFFFKQWGEWAPLEVCAEPAADWQPCGVDKTHIFPDGEIAFRIGKHAAGRVLDGRAWNEVPAAFTPAEAAR